MKGKDIRLEQDIPFESRADVNNLIGCHAGKKGQKGTECNDCRRFHGCSQGLFSEQTDLLRLEIAALSVSFPVS